jgi:hypothetical protein
MRHLVMGISASVFEPEILCCRIGHLASLAYSVAPYD